jgi:phage baseplate assembly protein W
MPNLEAPHFQIPFNFGANGHATCVEQDSEDDIFQCIQSVVKTPRGFRLELPGFGIDDPVFKEGGPDTADIASAIATWEPRANAVVDLTQDENVDQLAWDVLVSMESEA